MIVSTGLILRVTHIGLGVFWAGATLLLAGFIEPAVGGLGADGSKFVKRLMGPGRLGVFMTSASLVTVVSGVVLLWMRTGSNPLGWWGFGYGRAILLGWVAGTMAMIVGLTVNAPTARRLAFLGQQIETAGGAPRPEQLAEVSRLQRRLQLGGILSAVLLALSVLAMAAAKAL